jgi:hypothetical protein
MNLFRFLTGKHEGRVDDDDLLLTAKYDFWRGDLDLVNVQETDTDHKLYTFFERFAASPAPDRARIRKLNARWFTEFRWYPLRAAVLALKYNDARWVVSGLAAIAGADSGKIPPPFSEGALAFLFHVGLRVAPNDVSAQFQAAVEIADSLKAVYITQFLQLPPDAKEARFAAFETEVHTDDGTGFILAGGENYRPTYDLAQLIVRLRKLISLDQYEPQSVSLGRSVPEISFRKYSRGAHPFAQLERSMELADALNGIRGAAAIVARLRPFHNPNHEVYSLLANVIECAGVATREFLGHRLAENQTLTLVHVSEGSLLCSVQAIAVRPAPPYENDETLNRFARPIAEVLQSARRIEAA